MWIPEAEQWLTENYGQMVAQGAEAKVYYKTGDIHVVKSRNFPRKQMPNGLGSSTETETGIVVPLLTSTI